MIGEKPRVFITFDEGLYCIEDGKVYKLNEDDVSFVEKNDTVEDIMGRLGDASNGS